ncbi:unnamed protein product [Paramecium sonneborni]|uniref:Uncharacterized protein n=1 Tax=Paramecium sonneborni TaxID=65129 RepID=A0A8S1RDB7_9CILI|nr:unnamed protein product [Paramecium sonneborni]
MQTRNWESKKLLLENLNRKKELSKWIINVQQVSETNRNFFSNFSTFYEQYQDKQIPSIEFLQEQFHIQELFTNQQIYELQEELSKQWIIRVKKNWTDEDKQILIWIVLKICSRDGIHIRKIPTQVWEEVVQLISRRTVEQCKNKWNDLLKLSLQQIPWTQEQDEYLIQLINQSKEEGMQNKWCNLANLLNLQFKDSPRTGKQCRERWNNHLNPDINRHPWSIEEDIELLELVKKKQKKWAFISKILKSKRSENAVKNRYNCLLKKNNCSQINTLIDILKKRYQSENPSLPLQTLKRNKIIHANQTLTPQTQKVIKTNEYTIQSFDLADGNQLKQLVPAFYDSKTQTLFISNKNQLISFLSNQMIKIESECNIQNFDQNNQQHEFSNQMSGLLNLVDSTNFAKYVPGVFANQQQPNQQEKKSQFNIPGVQIEQANSEKLIENKLRSTFSFFSSKLNDTLLNSKARSSIEQEDNNHSKISSFK